MSSGNHSINSPAIEPDRSGVQFKPAAPAAQ
jgi:hypothetical protein